MAEILDKVRDVAEGQIDFEGQRLSEFLLTVLLSAVGVSKHQFITSPNHLPRQTLNLSSGRFIWRRLPPPGHQTRPLPRPRRIGLGLPRYRTRLARLQPAPSSMARGGVEHDTHATGSED